MSYIISADEFKKTMEGYDPARSGDFHSASAKMADQAFYAALKDRSEPLVIFMAGGAASGKSEYVSAYLETQEAIIFDGTLPSIEGASIKIRKAHEAGKQIAVHFVLPADLLVAYVVFLNRERKFAQQHFFATHSKARKTTLEVAERFPSVPITIISSDVDFVGWGGSMLFHEITFPDHAGLIAFLQANQYTEAELRTKMYHE